MAKSIIGSSRSIVVIVAALAATGGACRSETKGRTDSSTVSIDSGALSPVPPAPSPADMTPALADTGTKRVSQKPSVDTALDKRAVSPAGTRTPAPRQIPESVPKTTHIDSAPMPTPTPTPIENAATPATTALHFLFGRGEKFDYQVKFGPVGVGSATMEIIGVDTLRGVPAYHAVFNVRGGITFYKVNDRYESWFHPQSFASLRFIQDIDEGSYEAKRSYEIFPDRQSYSENGKPEQPSVADPLDEASLIYLLRAMPLEVGKTYDLNRYFRPDRNPVRVQVLRKERITVPAGTFDCIVVRPSIKTKGIFSDGGHAEVWFTDDSVRTMVQMKSKLSFGSLNLYLRSAHRGDLFTDGR